MRSAARETVFKFLYSQLFNQTDGELFAHLKKEIGLNQTDCKFADELLSFIEKDKEYFLEFIQKNSLGFKINRIFSTDKCSLLIGMAEMKNYPQTDLPIIIDEAVKLASKFSTEKSTDFVNGILAKYAKELNRG